MFLHSIFFPLKIILHFVWRGSSCLWELPSDDLTFSFVTQNVI